MVGMVRPLFQQSGSSFCRTVTLALVIGMIAMLSVHAPSHAETLSESGTVLADQLVDFSTADITRTIELGGDTPSSTYVMAHTTGGKHLQRTNLGYWIPWNGKVDELIDNKFQASGGTITYKIVSQDITDFMFPINFVLAYRVGSVLKFGVFQVSPN